MVKLSLYLGLAISACTSTPQTLEKEFWNQSGKIVAIASDSIPALQTQLDSYMSGFPNSKVSVQEYIPDSIKFFIESYDAGLYHSFTSTLSQEFNEKGFQTRVLEKPIHFGPYQRDLETFVGRDYVNRKFRKDNLDYIVLVSVDKYYVGKYFKAILRDNCRMDFRLIFSIEIYDLRKETLVWKKTIANSYGDFCVIDFDNKAQIQNAVDKGVEHACELIKQELRGAITSGTK